MFPSNDELTICFAHAAYDAGALRARRTGIRNFEVRNRDDFQKRVGEADVLVVSGLWKNELIPMATKLKFIQSISAGIDQYARELLPQGHPPRQRRRRQRPRRVRSTRSR